MMSPIIRLPDGEAPADRVEGEVDEAFLAARQIRLYIDNTPEYVALAAPAFVAAVAILWPFLPSQHMQLVLWAAAQIGTYLARLGAWMVFRRAARDDQATRAWLSWFFLPQVCGVVILSASMVLFLPNQSGNSFALLLSLALFFAVGMLLNTLQVAAYRPLIGPLVATAVLVFGAGVVRVPGSLPLLLGFGAFIIGIMAYRLAGKLNQAFVRSMELSIRNERLVSALKVRTAQLQEQTLAAERAERDKTRFLAAASHDLRQPMHAISMLVGMLAPRAGSGEREVVDRLERSVEEMDRLFGTVLDLSKLDAGVVKPVIAAVPLRSVFESIEVHFAPEAASKGLTLTVFPSRAIVSTDLVLLDRILRNFVSNAVKYTLDGRVLVGCRRRGEKLLVAVWDTGVGVAHEDLERIFEEYYRVGGVPRNRSEGLGLGLSIVRRLARLLGTEVAVESAPGRGSSFGLEIPLVGYRPAEEHRTVEGVASDAALAGKLILIVDDEPDIRSATESLLRKWGCMTVTASTLEEVEATLEQELRFPDVIVTDYRIGGAKTALDVIETVRRYTGETTPAIIVTGEEPGKIEFAGSACAVAPKPLSADQLRHHLTAALDHDLSGVT